jgi:tetratricopeptide (TPR) repeat protein
MAPARASYLEGREHFLKRRLHEAQICFASAILLDPLMLEAQLLRREVDRTLSRVRATTGTPTSMPIDVPASLREVREVVVAGRIRDAIALLSTDKYATNADAALFRARLLALDGQLARAASAFAEIVDEPHVDEARLGLARVTIDRGKPEAALGLLDGILVTRPRDLGALEARARCLELLGRTEEASEAMKDFVAAVELASDVRLSRSR